MKKNLGYPIDLILSIVLLQLIVPNWAMAVTTVEGVDGTNGAGSGVLQDIDTGKAFCSESAVGAQVTLPSGSNLSLNSCSSSTVVATDIGTTTPTAGAIPIAGTNSKLDIGWLPVGTDSNSVAAGTDTRFGVWTGTATLTNYVQGTDTRLSNGRDWTNSATLTNYVLGTDTRITSAVSGSLTTNYLPKATGAQTLGNSALLDNGTDVTVTGAAKLGIGISPTETLDVNGSVLVRAPDDGVNYALAIRQNNAPTYGFDFKLDTLVDGKLHIARVNGGSAADVLVIDRGTGTVEIGSAAATKFSVDADGTISAYYTGSNGFQLHNTGSGPQQNHLRFYNTADELKGLWGLANSSGGLVTGSAANDMAFRTQGGKLLFSTDSGNTAMVAIDAGGRLGIGTAAPAQLLDIGDIGATSGNTTNTIRVSGRHVGTDGDFASMLFSNSTDSGGKSMSIHARREGDNLGVSADLHVNNSYANGGADVTAMTWKYNGNVGIGTTTPGALLSLGSAGTTLGNLSMAGNTSGVITLSPAASAGTWSLTLPTTAGSAGQALVTDGSGVTTWTAPSTIYTPSSPATVGTGEMYRTPIAIAADGNYAYAVNGTTSALIVADVSNPTAPTEERMITVGATPMAVAVVGRYVYTANDGDSTISVVDVGDPYSMSVVGSVSVGSHPRSIAASGSYAYVGGWADGKLYVVDVSKPTAPVNVGSVTIGGGVRGVAVAGKYVYAVCQTDSKLYVVDVADPTAPVVAGSVVVGTTPYAVTVVGRYAYTANYGDSKLYVVSVFNPGGPFVVGSLDLGVGPLVSLAAAGQYVYTANYSDNSMSVVDVSDPEAPAVTGTASVGVHPIGVAVVGRYAYVANVGATTISVVDIGAGVLNAPVGWISSLRSGTMDVTQRLTVDQEASIKGSASVGKDLFVGDTIAATSAVVTGKATVYGGVKLIGSNNVAVTIKAAAAGSGVWNLTLPTSTGSPGQALVTDGSGNTTWSSVGTSTSTSTSTGSIYAGNGLGISTGTSTTTATVAALSNSPKFVLTATTTATSTAYVPITEVINGHTMTATNISITAGDVGAAPAFSGTSGYIPKFNPAGTSLVDAAPYSSAAAASTIAVSDLNSRLDGWTTHRLDQAIGPASTQTAATRGDYHLLASIASTNRAYGYQARVDGLVIMEPSDWAKCTVDIILASSATCSGTVIATAIEQIDGDAVTNSIRTMTLYGVANNISANYVAYMNLCIGNEATTGSCVVSTNFARVIIDERPAN